MLGALRRAASAGVRLQSALKRDSTRDCAALIHSAAITAARGGLASTRHAASAPSWARAAVGTMPSARQSRSFADEAKPKKTGETISVTFVDKDGERITVRAPVGENLMEVAHANNVDLEGACEGSLACSTCHLIVDDKAMFAKLPEPTDDENDMLDLAFGLTDTSRLGCQVIAEKAIDGIVVRLPAATRNMAVDGYKPKPH